MAGSSEGILGDPAGTGAARLLLCFPLDLNAWMQIEDSVFSGSPPQSLEWSPCETVTAACSFPTQTRPHLNSNKSVHMALKLRLDI